VLGRVSAVSARHQAGSGRRCTVEPLGELLVEPVYGEAIILTRTLTGLTSPAPSSTQDQVIRLGDDHQFFVPFAVGHVLFTDTIR
jgi:hypothetical protein